MLKNLIVDRSTARNFGTQILALEKSVAKLFKEKNEHPSIIWGTSGYRIEGKA